MFNGEKQQNVGSALQLLLQTLTVCLAQATQHTPSLPSDQHYCGATALVLLTSFQSNNTLGNHSDSCSPTTLHP